MNRYHADIVVRPDGTGPETLYRTRATARDEVEARRRMIHAAVRCGYVVTRIERCKLQKEV